MVKISGRQSVFSCWCRRLEVPGSYAKTISPIRHSSLRKFLVATTRFLPYPRAVPIVPYANPRRGIMSRQERIRGSYLHPSDRTIYQFSQSTSPRSWTEGIDKSRAVAPDDVCGMCPKIKRPAETSADRITINESKFYDARIRHVSRGAPLSRRRTIRIAD